MKKKLLFFCLLMLWESGMTLAQKPSPIDPELQKLKANLAAAKHDTTRMMALMDIANYYKNIRLQPDSGLVYALKAEQIANQYPNYAKTIKVFNTIGATYFLLRNNTVDITLKKKYPELAGQYFKKSLDLARKFKNEEYVIKSWYNIVENLRFFSKYPYFKSSFELIHYIQKKPQLTGLDSLVLRLTCKKVCYDLDYEMGSKQYNTYFALFKNVTPKKGNDYNELCILTFDQQVVLGKKSDEQHILKQYAAYQQVFKILEHKDELNLSLIQYYFAIQDYKKSYQMCTDFAPQKYGNANTKFAFLGFKYMLMGKNAYMLNRNQETIRNLQKAITFFNVVLNEYGLENEKYTALIYLSKAYKKAGNYKQALACTEQADVLYKEIHDVGRQALMAENDVQLEQIKQDKKVQDAQTQALLKEQEAQIEKRQKYVFALLALVALLSTAWAFYNFRKTRQQNAIISQQAAALEESNLLKDKIFALLSHDLRSPINRLVMSLNHSIESQRTHIQSELKSVQDILNNVLYWASMQLKKATPVYTNMPLQPLADALIDEYQYALEEKNITFLNTIDKDCLIKTDEGYLKIVLRNLISNAIKFTPNNGFIQIDCNIKENIAQIRLRDTGVGIAKEKLNSLFQLPMPSVGTNQEKGTGLGLSLSLDIVKKLGGNINIQSQEGKGTQVEVALPFL